MDALEFRNLYWNYYTQLENDFFSYSPYCEIDPCNDNAFSVKYLQLLLSVCGEIDSICKTFCKVLENDFDPDKAGIDNYISIFREKYPTFATERVKILGYKYREVQPWKSIAYGNHVPSWWQDYNAIKHHRDQERNRKANYKYANQKNVLNALCALYILIEYWAAKNFVAEKDIALKRTGDPSNYTLSEFMSSKLKLVNWEFYFSFMGQKPWFHEKAYYEYLEGGLRP